MSLGSVRVQLIQHKTQTTKQFECAARDIERHHRDIKTLGARSDTIAAAQNNLTKRVKIIADLHDTRLVEQAREMSALVAEMGELHRKFEVLNTGQTVQIEMQKETAGTLKRVFATFITMTLRVDRLTKRIKKGVRKFRLHKRLVIDNRKHIMRYVKAASGADPWADRAEQARQ